jgi:hypothetical protein
MVFYYEFYVQGRWRMPDDLETSYVFTTLANALRSIPLIAARLDLSRHDIRIKRSKGDEVI